MLAAVGLATQAVYLRSGGVVGVRRITSAISQATSGGVTSALVFARRLGAATATGNPLISRVVAPLDNQVNQKNHIYQKKVHLNLNLKASLTTRATYHI